MFDQNLLGGGQEVPPPGFFVFLVPLWL